MLFGAESICLIYVQPLVQWDLQGYANLDNYYNKVRVVLSVHPELLGMSTLKLGAYQLG